MDESSVLAVITYTILLFRIWFVFQSGASGSWGERANRDLRVVRGKNFSREKTKKKRGTYLGGTIETKIHSIKFDDDE